MITELSLSKKKTSLFSHVNKFFVSRGKFNTMQLLQFMAWSASDLSNFADGINLDVRSINKLSKFLKEDPIVLLIVQDRHQK